MFRRSTRLCAATLLLATAALPATAQQRDPDGWSVTLGGAAAYAPDYEGSDDYEFGGFPLVDVTYGRFFFGRQGLGVNLPVTDTLTLGVALGGDGGRDADDNSALRGLGDVDATAEAVLFAEWDLDPVTLSAEVRQDILGDGHEGAVVTVGGSIALLRSQDLILDFGPTVTWASDSYMQTYFGIDTAQAARSGRAVYNAGAGFKDVSLGLVAIHPLDAHWSLTGILSYSRLLGDAADSPLVDRDGSADQFVTAVGLAYRF